MLNVEDVCFRCRCCSARCRSGWAQCHCHCAFLGLQGAWFWFLISMGGCGRHHMKENMTFPSLDVYFVYVIMFCPKSSWRQQPFLSDISRTIYWIHSFGCFFEASPSCHGHNNPWQGLGQWRAGRCTGAGREHGSTIHRCGRTGYRRSGSGVLRGFHLI